MTKNYDSAVELLRKWMRGTRADGLGPLGTSLKELEEIADMVEAELEAEREEAAFWEAEHDAELRRRIAGEKLVADMELPVDAYGVPIRMGDVVIEEEFRPQGGTVVGMRTHRSIDHWQVNCGVWVDSRRCRHVKPDTVESLLEDMVKDIASEHVIYVQDDKKDEFGARLRDIRDDYAERIRKAAHDGN